MRDNLPPYVEDVLPIERESRVLAWCFLALLFVMGCFAGWSVYVWSHAR